MRTGNPLDGMYFLIFIVPIVLGLWAGDIVRKKIQERLILQSSFGHNFSSCISAIAEVIIISVGIITGFILIKVI